MKTSKTKRITSYLMLLSLCCSIFLSNFQVVFALEDTNRYTVTIQESEHGSLRFIENGNYEDVYKENVNHETVDTPIEESAVQGSAYTFSVDENGNIIQKETIDNAGYIVPNEIIDPMSKNIRKGDIVELDVLPEAGYEVETIYIVNEKGKSVTYSYKNSKISFTMPRSSVTIKVLFTNELTNIVTDDSVVDNYTYIKSNINKDYATFNKWESINSIVIKQTILDKSLFDKYNLPVTMENLNICKDDIPMFTALLDFQIANSIIYNIDDNSDYYVSFIDTLHNDEIEVTDYAVANNNILGEELEGNYYDYNTGILYIKKDYVKILNISDDYSIINKNDINNIQVQLLQTYVNDDTSHNIELIINDNKNVLDIQSSTLNVNQYDSTINIKLSDNTTIDNNFSISINDILMVPQINLQEFYHDDIINYDCDTKILSISNTTLINIYNIEIFVYDKKDNTVNLNTAYAAVFSASGMGISVDAPTWTLLEGDPSTTVGDIINISPNTVQYTTSKYGYQLDESTKNEVFIGGSLYYGGSCNNPTPNVEYFDKYYDVYNNLNYPNGKSNVMNANILYNASSWTHYANLSNILNTSDTTNPVIITVHNGNPIKKDADNNNISKYALYMTNNKTSTLLSCCHATTYLNNNYSNTEAAKQLIIKILNVDTINKTFTWSLLTYQTNTQAGVQVYKSSYKELKTGTFQMEKTFNKSSSLSDIPLYSLKGSTYSLYKQNDDKTYTKQATLKSNSKGKFNVVTLSNSELTVDNKENDINNNSDKTAIIGNLPVGFYKLKEDTASAGYNLTEAQTFEIGPNDHIKIEAKSNIDYPVFIRFKAQKLDSSNSNTVTDHLLGAQFKLYYSSTPFFNNNTIKNNIVTINSDKTVSVTTNDTIKLIGTFETKKDSNGVIKTVPISVGNNIYKNKDVKVTISNDTLSNCPLGYYLYVESKLPNGYEQELVNNYPVLYSLDFPNRPTTNGSIKDEIQIFNTYGDSVPSGVNKYKITYNNTTYTRENINTNSPTTFSFTMYNSTKSISAKKSFLNLSDEDANFISCFANTTANYNSTHYKLAGAKFDVYVNNVYKGNATSDSTGKLVFNMESPYYTKGYTVYGFKTNDIIKLVEITPSLGTHKYNTSNNSYTIKSSDTTTVALDTKIDSVKQVPDTINIKINKKIKLSKGAKVNSGSIITFEDLDSGITSSTERITKDNTPITVDNAYLYYTNAGAKDKNNYFKNIKFEVWYNPYATESNSTYFPKPVVAASESSATITDVNSGYAGRAVKIGNIEINGSNITLTRNDFKIYNNGTGSKTVLNTYKYSKVSNGYITKLPLGAYMFAETYVSYDSSTNISGKVNDPIYEYFTTSGNKIVTYENGITINSIKLSLVKQTKNNTYADLTGAKYQVYYSPTSLNSQNVNTREKLINNKNIYLVAEFTTKAYVNNNVGFLSNSIFSNPKSLRWQDDNGNHITNLSTIKGINGKTLQDSVNMLNNNGLITNTNYIDSRLLRSRKSIIDATSVYGGFFNTLIGPSGYYILVETEGPLNTNYTISDKILTYDLTSKTKGSLTFTSEEPDSMDPLMLNITKKSTNSNGSDISGTNIFGKSLENTIFKINFIPNDSSNYPEVTFYCKTLKQTNESIGFNTAENNFIQKYIIAGNYTSETTIDILRNKYLDEKNKTLLFPAGRFIITEEKAADGYIHDNTDKFNITIDDINYNCGSTLYIDFRDTINESNETVKEKYIWCYNNNSWSWKQYSSKNIASIENELDTSELNGYIGNQPDRYPIEIQKVNGKENIVSGFKKKFRLIYYTNNKVEKYHWDFETTDTGYFNSINSSVFANVGGKPLINGGYYSLNEINSNGNIAITTGIQKYDHDSNPNLANYFTRNTDKNTTNYVINYDFPSLESNAVIKGTSSKYTYVQQDNIKVSDKITLHNVIVGNIYIIEGIGIDVSTRKPIKDANGNYIRSAKAVYITGDTSGKSLDNYETTLEYEFSIKDKSFENKTINFYEYLLYVGTSNKTVYNYGKDLTGTFSDYNYIDGTVNNINNNYSNLESTLKLTLNPHNNYTTENIPVLNIDTNGNINTSNIGAIYSNNDKSDIVRHASTNNILQNIYIVKLESLELDSKTRSHVTNTTNTEIIDGIEYRYATIFDIVDIYNVDKGNFKINYSVKNSKNDGSIANNESIAAGIKEVLYNDIVTDESFDETEYNNISNIIYNPHTRILRVPITIKIQLNNTLDPDDIKEFYITDIANEWNTNTGKIRPIAFHENKVNSQTGYITGTIETNLLTSDNSKIINTRTPYQVTLKDTITFKENSLNFNHYYMIVGYIVDKSTNITLARNIKFITGINKYNNTPTSAFNIMNNKDINVENTFNIPIDTINNYKGHTLVAYEYVSDYLTDNYNSNSYTSLAGYLSSAAHKNTVRDDSNNVLYYYWNYDDISNDLSMYSYLILNNQIGRDANINYLSEGAHQIQFNAGLLYQHADLYDEKQSVIIPDMSTKAFITDNNSKYIDLSKNTVNITDTVKYVGLEKNKTYYLYGYIIDKSQDDKILAIQNTTITTSNTYNQNKYSTKNINFKNLNTSLFKNINEIVIYEYLFNRELSSTENVSINNRFMDSILSNNSKFIMSHNDSNDAEQTLGTIMPKTLAVSAKTNSKLISNNEDTTIIDTFYYKLIRGTRYHLLGYLIDTSTNTVIDKKNIKFTASGNTVSGSVLDLVNGTISLKFNLSNYSKTANLSTLEGHTLVVYEYLYNGDGNITWTPIQVGKTFSELTDDASISRLIAKHADVNDTDQQVKIPKISTKAFSTDNGTKVVFAGTSVKISDTVNYSNLIVNDEYRLCGYIVDKSTHKIIARASSKFTASAANSNFTLAFSNVNASNVSGKELVIYEYLYSGGDTFTWPQNSVGSTFSAANIINDASYSRYLTEHVDDNDKDQTLYVPEIYTNAVSTEFGGHLLPADKTTTIKDTITYKKLISDDWYRINGYLVDKSNNKIIAVQTKTFQPDNTKSKTPVNGSCSINYSINTTNMGNHTFVIYEYVYTGNGAVSHGNNTVGKTFSDPANAARLVGKHYDRNDSKQTVYVPLVSTTANNNKINDHLILANNSAEIVDTISYNKLVKNNTYRYYGFIVNKEDNKILTTKTGTFKASGTEIDTVNHIVDSGTVKVTFSNIDLRSYEGKTFVIYEYVFNGSAGVRVTMGANSTFDESKIAKDTLIAKHYAPNDFDQQIGTVKIGTQAINTVTNNNLVLANGQASIKDTVSYTNVLSNTGYHILGYLVDLDDANKVIAKKSVKFNSKTTTTKSYVNGTVEVPFTFDASNLAGHRLVVYEYLYYSQANVSWGPIKVGESFHELTENEDSAAYKRLIAIHKNDEDEKQNVYVVKVGTTASNNVDNIKLVLADTNANIVDSVHCQNLIQGQSYRLCGYLIDKRTNIVVRKITKTFTASSNTTFTNMSVVKATNSYTIVNGYVNLNFDINASKYENTDLVVYEYLYMNTTNVDWSSIIEEQTNASVLNSINSKDRLIGIHNERDDKGQTVYVPKARTTASVVNNNQRVTPDENGSQKVRPDASVELKDTISYNNLLSKSPYTVFGYLVDTNNTPNDTSDDKLVASQRKTFTSNSTNTVGGSNGNVDINFTFDARKFAGKSVVIYEYIYTGNVNANAMTYKPNVGDKFVLANVPTKITNNTGIGVLIAKHADSTDRKQTIVVTMPIEFIKKDYDNNILAGTTLRFSKVNNVDMNNLANIKPDDIKNNSLTKLAEWVTTTDFYRYEDVEEGIYVIEEIHASKSHAIVVPVYITVRKDAANNNMFKAYYTGTNEELGRHNNNTQYQSIILYDPELTKLPTAGSTGTLLYTVFGMMLMMGSYYMLKRKKLFKF